MKNKREILLLGLGTLCLVTLISCNDKADEEASVGELIIEPSVGIGPVKFGMSKEEVTKHFGLPDKVLADGTKLNYVSSRGLSFTVDSELGLQEIGCWSEGMLPSRITTFAGKTKEGIGIGSYFALLHDFYGMPNESSPNHEIYYYNDRLFYIHYENSFIKLVQINFRHKF